MLPKDLYFIQNQLDVKIKAEKFKRGFKIDIVPNFNTLADIIIYEVQIHNGYDDGFTLKLKSENIMILIVHHLLLNYKLSEVEIKLDLIPVLGNSLDDFMKNLEKNNILKDCFWGESARFKSLFEKIYRGFNLMNSNHGKIELIKSIKAQDIIF